MNSNFRRDYLYRTTKQLTASVGDNELIRYLKYDKKNKNYIFLTGMMKNNREQVIKVHRHVIHLVNRNLEKLGCIGYEQTDGYENSVGE